MQDPTGDKYLAFHRLLMSGSGQVNKATALAAARDIGLNLEKIERDILSTEVKSTIDESKMLAGALGITGTPSYVVGETVVIGAAGRDVLAERIVAARK